MTVPNKEEGRYLNFGAGNPVAGWINWDASPLFRIPRWGHALLAGMRVSSRSASFLRAPYRYYRYEAEGRLPLEDATVEAIYCSHVLEHLPCASVAPLLGEFRRVLRPGGIARILVPDLAARMDALLKHNGGWADLAEPLGTIPPQVARGGLRAALEGWAAFPSFHRTVFFPGQLTAALGAAWEVKTGLAYLESAISPARLEAVEREDRCRGAAIFEVTPRRE